MKGRLTILSLIIPLALFFSCEKKEAQANAVSESIPSAASGGGWNMGYIIRLNASLVFREGYVRDLPDPAAGAAFC